MILLIDDNQAHRKLVKRALKKAGVTVAVREAHSLNDARAQLEHIEPSLLVLDLNLGDGRGTELISEIRNHQHFKTIPIIVISTSSLPSDISESLEAGASCYLTKADDILHFSAEVAEGVKEWLPGGIDENGGMGAKRQC